MPFVRVKDLEFFYERTEFTVPWEKNHEKILFLHGLHGSLSYWNHYQVGFFSKYFNVLNIDQRGHGRSFKPSFGYTIPNMADDIIKIIEKMYFSPVNLVGASMGGMVALQIAIQRPSLLDSLVLVDSFPYSPDPLKRAVKAWTSQVEKDGYAKVMETFNSDNPTLFSKEYMEKRSNFIDFDDKEVQRNLMPAEAFIGACEAIIEFDAREKLDQIKTPTLLVTSNEGLGFEAATFMKSKIKNAQLWAPEGYGHLINIEAPEIFNKQLLNFFQAIKK